MAQEHVTKEEAKQLIDDAESGFIAVVEAEEKDVLGTIPPEEREVKVEANTCGFGLKE